MSFCGKAVPEHLPFNDVGCLGAGLTGLINEGTKPNVIIWKNCYCVVRQVEAD
jgi:hypothetical protein